MSDPRIFFNEYFRRKPMRLAERLDANLFTLDLTGENDFEYMSVSDHLKELEVLKAENELCVKVSIELQAKVALLEDEILRLKNRSLTEAHSEMKMLYEEKLDKKEKSIGVLENGFLAAVESSNKKTNELESLKELLERQRDCANEVSKIHREVLYKNASLQKQVSTIYVQGLLNAIDRIEDEEACVEFEYSEMPDVLKHIKYSLLQLRKMIEDDIIMSGGSIKITKETT